MLPTKMLPALSPSSPLVSSFLGLAAESWRRPVWSGPVLQAWPGTVPGAPGLKPIRVWKSRQGVTGKPQSAVVPPTGTGAGAAVEDHPGRPGPRRRLCARGQPPTAACRPPPDPRDGRRRQLRPATPGRSRASRRWAGSPSRSVEPARRCRRRSQRDGAIALVSGPPDQPGGQKRLQPPASTQARVEHLHGPAPS